MTRSPLKSIVCLSLKSAPPFNQMKIIYHLLALASLASLACGIAFLLFSAPIPALLGFLGFALFGLVAAKINPEL